VDAIRNRAEISSGLTLPLSEICGRATNTLLRRTRLHHLSGADIARELERRAYSAHFNERRDMVEGVEGAELRGSAIALRRRRTLSLI
jgi:hypothetical protein